MRKASESYDWHTGGICAKRNILAEKISYARPNDRTLAGNRSISPVCARVSGRQGDVVAARNESTRRTSASLSLSGLRDPRPGVAGSRSQIGQKPEIRWEGMAGGG